MKEKKQNAVKKGRVALLIGGLLLCLLLCSCAGCDGCVRGCGMIQSWYRPELVSGSGAASAPEITHSPSAEEVNAQLGEYYEPIAALVENANKSRNIFSLEHELTEREGCWYLQSSIVCRPEGAIELPEMYIPYFGPATVPENILPELSDSDLAAVWLELTANDIDCDLSRLEEELSLADILGIYVDYYTQVSGLEIDISRFDESVEYDGLLRQAMVLGLIEYPGFYDAEYADIYDLLQAASGLLSSMYYDACGCGTEGFTRSELLELICDFVGMDIYSEPEWKSSAKLIGRLCREMLADSASDADSELLRQQTAQILVQLYEGMYGPIYVEDYYYNGWMEDTSDEYCIKASWLDLMSDFPKQYLFSEFYTPGRRELPEFVKQFTVSCRDACLRTAEENGESDRITYRDAMTALSVVDLNVRKRGLCPEEPVVVSNDRDYEWYYTQHGTGEYSYVNCMPTIAMMGTKWYDENTTVTIREMRQRYLPEYDGGWYTWQVAECLEENGVPNELVEITEDKLAYLNDGKIILSQMSEAAGDASGHCFIIYGYWKRGDSIKYFVHDPDVYDGTDDYGRRPGYAMVLDGRYCDWIIERIAFNYIVVG